MCASFKKFVGALRIVFDLVATDREKARELSRLQQGADSVCDYAIRFRTLATESRWNDTALYDVFLKGLSDPIQDLLVPLDLPPDLDSLISLTIRTDNRLQERKQQCGSSSVSATTPDSSAALGRTAPRRFPPEQCLRPSAEQLEEPMQLGRSRLSREEQQRRSQEGKCFYCGTLSRRLPRESGPGGESFHSRHPHPTKINYGKDHAPWQRL